MTGYGQFCPVAKATEVIGDNVTITVLGVKGNQVRVGIEAPRDVPVHREEIYKRILKERAADTTQAAMIPHQTV